MESLNKLCIGGIIGSIKEGYRDSYTKTIGRINEIGSRYIVAEYQTSEKKDTTYIYTSYGFVFLPVTEEFLEIEGFNKLENDIWVNSDESIQISIEDGHWVLKLVKNSRYVLISDFEYIHELQFYCFQHDIPLNVRLGDCRILYDSYLDEYRKAKKK